MVRLIPLKPRLDPLFGLFAIAVDGQATALKDIIQVWPVESVERDLGQGRGWRGRNQTYERVDRVGRPLVRLHFYHRSARDVT